MEGYINSLNHISAFNCLQSLSDDDGDDDDDDYETNNKPDGNESARFLDEQVLGIRKQQTL
jgi:hypothetical protein